MRNEEDHQISGAQSFLLSSDEVRRMTELAQGGDSQAAFQLYMHYSFGLDEQKKGEVWLRKAAALGHPLAKQHLDVFRQQDH